MAPEIDIHLLIPLKKQIQKGHFQMLNHSFEFKKGVIFSSG